MELSLLSESDPNLYSVCTDWDFNIDVDCAEIVKSMAKVMFLHNGIGLAAPQVGIQKRIFIMGNNDNFVACINPRIIELGTELVRSIEGCVSFPNLWLKVKRSTTIKVEYTTIENKTVQTELSDLHARVFLHEFDHLLGITFDQRVGDLSLKLARQRSKKYSKKLKASA